MSSDMRLLAVSCETAVSYRSELMAVGLSEPLVSNGSTDLARATVFVTPPSGDTSCRLPTTACSPVTVEVAGRGADPAPGSDESPELASSLALRLPRADQMVVGVSGPTSKCGAAYPGGHNWLLLSSGQSHP
jgi:hypothetical protein